MPTVRDELVNTLDELVRDEPDDFTWHLSQREMFKQERHIPRGRVHGKSHRDIVDVMVEFYGKRQAVKITLFILGRMNKNQLVQDKGPILHNLLSQEEEPMA
ncbi:hypothetical protein AAFF_G00088590 [Aldrovandia affinis]|uniref:Pyrin domain-containing protein n=1 Tax=Aldrovandia affinis TaxID=143900 RepID=A0AAD7RWH3_9TELE|nr:hypothetical protein AAFF_G00088590 [Aldrovandia affinis]